MNNGFKVSVIVPVYNTAQYIQRCLASLMNQSYKNLEFILIDDGSTDASGRICDDLAKEDARVKVIHQENKGQGTARNTGLAVATGDYISFVDSDDYVASYMYEALINIVTSHEADIVCFNLHAGCEENFAFSREQQCTEVYESIDFLRGLFKIAHFDSSVLKIYKKELFEGIRFPEGRTQGEDVGIVYKLVYKANKIARYQEELYYYYQSPNSTMRGEFSLDKAQECDSFKERLLFFDEIGENKLFARSLLQYEAVLVRSYYYVKKLYPNEEELIEQLTSEIAFATDNIKKNKNISIVKKIIYIMAAFVPGLSGYVISRLL